VTGRAIPDPGFPGDTGGADPALAAALADHAAGRGDTSAVHTALRRARVLVPVVAVLAEEETPAEHDGSAALRREKSADMAVTTIVGRDGRRALPVFTSTSTLAAWREDARPVPVAVPHAALAAYAEEAEALVVDVAGPVRHVVEGAALRALAEDRDLLAPAHDPEVARAVAGVLARVHGLEGHALAASEGGDLRVTLHCAPGEDGAEVARRAASLLGEDEGLRGRLGGGLELAVATEG
jgi:hypothetical protein